MPKNKSEIISAYREISIKMNNKYPTYIEALDIIDKQSELIEQLLRIIDNQNKHAEQLLIMIKGKNEKVD